MDFRVLNLTFSKLIWSLKKYSSPIKLLHFLTGSPGRSCLGPLSCVFFFVLHRLYVHMIGVPLGEEAALGALCVPPPSINYPVAELRSAQVN